MRNYLPEDKYLNDGHLIGLRVGDGTVELEFLDFAGAPHRLSASGVYEATPFGFGLRNTVEGVYWEELTVETVGAALQEMKKFSNGRLLLGDMQKMSDHILKKGLGLLVVEPREGGGIVVICDIQSVKVSPIE